MGRPRANPGEAPTQERLLAAALVEFGENGYDATRLADIAATAGITRPSLLYYFPTKEALYETVVRDAFNRMAVALVSAMQTDGDFERRLEATVASFVSFVDARPHLARLIVREVIDGRGPGHDLVEAEGIPVLERVEVFVREEGGSWVGNLPIRDALLQVVASVLMRAGAGPLRLTLWGATDNTLALTRRLFFGVES